MIDAITLEQRLLHGYREQLDRYDRAAEILEQGEGSLPERLQSLENTNTDAPWASAVHAILEEAASLNAAMARDIAAWRESGRSPNAELQVVLERLGERIHTLSKRIDQRIVELRAHQHKLLPRIDEFIHKRRMLQAYMQHG